jgi:hypothetical protein
MSIDLLYDEDLPADARELIHAVEKEVEQLQAKAERDVARIRKKAEEDTQKAQATRDEAVRELQSALAQQLKPLQDAYAREGQLDEALAIRAQIRRLRPGVSGVEPAPDILECRAEDVGKSFLFEMVGTSRGPLWGTDIYTADSSPVTAAVHAGVLKRGERAVIKVTVLDTRDRISFEGSLRNGVQSDPWGVWDYGFQVARP